MGFSELTATIVPLAPINAYIFMCNEGTGSLVWRAAMFPRNVGPLVNRGLMCNLLFMFYCARAHIFFVELPEYGLV